MTQENKETTQKQYRGEDIFCKNEYNMVTEFTSDGETYITGYKRDMFNHTWVMDWIMEGSKKEA